MKTRWELLRTEMPPAGWVPVPQRLIDRAERFSIAVTPPGRSAGQGVPTQTGNLQVEWHENGWDVELEFERGKQLPSLLLVRAARDDDWDHIDIVTERQMLGILEVVLAQPQSGTVVQ